MKLGDEFLCLPRISLITWAGNSTPHHQAHPPPQLCCLLGLPPTKLKQLKFPGVVSYSHGCTMPKWWGPKPSVHPAHFPLPRPTPCPNLSAPLGSLWSASPCTFHLPSKSGSPATSFQRSVLLVGEWPWNWWQIRLLLPPRGSINAGLLPQTRDSDVREPKSWT